MASTWNESFQVNAVMDETGHYRYQFSCQWGTQGRFITFIMLNPSVGNQQQPDPTLRKCINYAKNWGYDGIKVANLFAYVSTDPQRLTSVVDPVGPDNDRHLLEMIQGVDRIVLAWGKMLPKSFVQPRIQEVLYLLRERDSYCLEKTKCGSFPKHPLFLKADLTPILFQSARH